MKLTRLGSHTPSGLSDWFNALPPYVSGIPLWQFGANDISNNVFTRAHSIYICPTAQAMPTVPPGPGFHHQHRTRRRAGAHVQLWDESAHQL